ncbi:2-pyrone-4,6-dicarboxylate hydrolase [Sulfuriferula sp. AH1]|uniref:amidohydrolase family protein n=1 Tax=Sulfuriferula sp. AH1 TaxID=1985873 RepID=UPI000B3B32DA|nr:amidohydrolase family protein [Sulfuriferula sp. AH1]ARU31582.1 2-pyrone-4,6-dicarboxylate hydrolase [Sulfuriferula sp. AH1]
MNSHAHVFDSHFHIIDPAFPLVPNNGYLPDPFTTSDYLVMARSLGVVGGVVVSGSFQAFDQDYLLSALERLGPKFVGVTQLPASVSDAEIRRLDERGVRAVRFNLMRGGSESVEHLESFARRVFDLVGWHAELYVDARDLHELRGTLLSLPAVSIDHLGLSKEGFPTLLRLAEKGVRIKATGFGRVEFPVGQALRAIHAANPHVLMFGTDLPSTRAPRPFEANDISLLLEALGNEGGELVLWKNAVNFYRLPC